MLYSGHLPISKHLETFWPIRLQIIHSNSSNVIIALALGKGYGEVVVFKVKYVSTAYVYLATEACQQDCRECDPGWADSLFDLEEMDGGKGWCYNARACWRGMTRMTETSTEGLPKGGCSDGP
jgi:hypothetical protein